MSQPRLQPTAHCHNALDRFVRLDARHLVEDSLRAATRLLEARGLRATVSAPQDPVWVDGDAACLKRAVQTLVADAIRVSRCDGDIAVRVASYDGDVTIGVRHVARRHTTVEPSRLPAGVAGQIARAHGGKLAMRRAANGLTREVGLILPAA